MSEFYDGIPEDVLEMIKEAGRSVEVLSPSAGQAYNAATDTFTAGADISVTVSGVFTQFSTKDIDGDLILRTDKKLLIAAAGLSFAPDNRHKVKDGSDIYRVINTEVVQPGSEPLLYKVQVRR